MMGRETSGRTPRMTAPKEGPPAGPDPAEDDHGKNDNGLAEAEVLGHDEGQEVGIKSSGQSGNGAAKNKSKDFETNDIHSHGLCSLFVLADRSPGQVRSTNGPAGDPEEAEERSTVRIRRKYSGLVISRPNQLGRLIPPMPIAPPKKGI